LAIAKYKISKGRLYHKSSGRSVSLSSVGGNLSKGIKALKSTSVTTTKRKSSGRSKPKTAGEIIKEWRKEKAPTYETLRKKAIKEMPEPRRKVTRAKPRITAKPKERLPTLKELKKAQPLVYREVPEKEKLKGLTRATRIARQRQLTEKVYGKRFVRGTIYLGTLGVGRGLKGVGDLVLHPKKSAKNIVEFSKAVATQPRTVVRAVYQDFKIDPVGVFAEYYTYSKAISGTAKAVKKSPVGRYVQEELFIRSQPKKLQPSVRSIIKGSKAQEKLNPHKIKSIKKVDFAEVKTLTKAEAKAIGKTIQETDSVVFGSLASRTLSKKKTPIPKDVDLATKSMYSFNKAFIKNLPKKLQKNYKIKGQKIIRIKDSSAIMDVKPISRLIPEKSLLTRKGQIPAVGYAKVLKKTKKSVLPRFVKDKVTGKLKVPTQRIKKVKGIRMTGFGEQTTRKGLGTLQVLIEKNMRRAKDPQSFVIGLEVQLKSLKKLPKTISRTSKIKTISSSLKILKSKEFSKLLDKKVPTLTSKYPLLAKINKAKLKNVQKLPKSKLNKLIEAKMPSKMPFLPKKPSIPSKIPKAPTLKKVPYLPSKLPKKTPSILPPIIPSKMPYIKPSKLPPIKPSKLPPIKPSKIPKPKPSKIPKPKPSKIPISKLPPIKPSKLPPIKPSKLPPIKPSKIPYIKVPIIRVPKVPKVPYIKPITIKKKYKIKKKKLKKKIPVKYTYTMTRAKKRKKLKYFTGVELR